MVAAEHIEQVEHALPRLLGGLTLLLHHREEQFQGIGGSPHGSETASRLQPHLLGGTGLPGFVDQGFDVLGPSGLEPGDRGELGHFGRGGEPGEHILSCRATDAAGNVQPIEQNWNWIGVGNNMAQAIPVTVR